ncbi:MAG: hypothetical protein HY735_28525 [Verrucomicrobia bacterium]|nr:hypothetical protein [Verrucomicrobiota bacterium]
MKSITDIKARIDKLEPSQLASLEQWLEEREQWQQGRLKECFVIMPFSMTKDGRSRDYWTTIFDDFLGKSLAACGYRARRSEANPGNIVEGIMEDLAWSDVVLAVLTDSNPNVWYELGVRHSLRRGGTIMICQEDQTSVLPFDLKHHGVVDYTSSLERGPFVDKLSAQLTKIDGKTEDSPVSGFANAGLAYCIHRALAGRRQVVRRLKQFTVDRDDSSALYEVNRMNQEWAQQSLQVTVIKDDKVLCHQGGVDVGADANLCFEDAIMRNESQYPRMKSYGSGLWLGSMRGHVGRLTAVAYETLPERGWMVVIESHVRQADL